MHFAMLSRRPVQKEGSHEPRIINAKGCGDSIPTAFEGGQNVVIVSLAAIRRVEIDADGNQAVMLNLEARRLGQQVAIIVIALLGLPPHRPKKPLVRVQICRRVREDDHRGAYFSAEP